MSKIQNTPNRAAFDVRAAEDLKRQFQANPQEGLKAAAQQFETLFLQQVLKSMRDTVPQDDMLSSDQSRFYTGLLDQQLAQNMATSGKGIGFAKLIEQQLGAHLQKPGATPDDLANAVGQATSQAATAALPLTASDGRHLAAPAATPARPAPVMPATAAETAPAVGNELPASPGDFVNRVWPHAVDASRSTGIPPQFLVAQAALESGWGRSEVRRPDGTGSYNLFGIKAGRSWAGETVDAATTEYVNGQPVSATERFRAYGSYAESFRDYANLLRGNARFSQVIGSQDGAEFARRLQQAGYATDPQYAEKLTKIINGPTLRQALIG